MRLSLFVLLLLQFFWQSRPECYNGCSGHGKCTLYDMCVCARNWQANDCSERVCQFGLAFVDTPKGDLDSSGKLDGPSETVAVNSFVYPYGTSESYPKMRDASGKLLTQSGHAYAECSNAGICDRKTGTCICQEGFEGVACQRLTCPTYPEYGGICSGHGHCQTITSITRRKGKQSSHDAYALWDRQLSTACVCDPGFFGGDCHMRRCKQAVDPLYIDDFNMVSYGRYYFAFLHSNRNATFSDGVGGQAYFRLRIYDNSGEGWLTDKINYPASCRTITAALEALPQRVIPHNTTICTQATQFDLDPLARRPGWRVSTYARYKGFFNNNPRKEWRNVNPTFWAQNFHSTAAKNSSSDAKLSGHIFLIEFYSLLGDVQQPDTILYSDGRRSTMIADHGQLFTNVWTDGQRAEATDHFTYLCPKLTVRIDTTSLNYHFLTGFSGEEKLVLMKCLADADFDPSNNVPILGQPGNSWDLGSSTFPHLVKMVRVVTDTADSGFYVALYYDTTVTDIDGGVFGPHAALAPPGTFKLLHPFESLDHLVAVQYYIFTSKGTLQVAGGKTEAAFDFGTRLFYTTNQTHVIDTGVYWRVNETQTVELKGTDVDEVQVLQTNTASAPEIQTVTVSTAFGSSGSVQVTGVLIYGGDLAAGTSCTEGSKCLAIENRLSGAISFRFDPGLCGSYGRLVTSDTNLCLQALAELNSKAYSNVCPTSTDCVSVAVSLPFTASALQTALCNIMGKDGSTPFAIMKDQYSKCVNVTDLSKLMEGAYQYAFQITFVGQTLQGDVPPITIATSTMAYTYSAVSILPWKLNFYGEYRFVPVSDMHTPGSAALILTRGNQADGYFALGYTCEAKWTEVTLQTTRVNATQHFADKVEIIAGDAFLRLGHVFRYPGFNTYHTVTSLHSSCTATAGGYLTCKKGFVTPGIMTMGNINLRVTGELGVFYSDPAKVDPNSDSNAYVSPRQMYFYSVNNFGVSYNCRVRNYNTTGAMSAYATASQVRQQILQILRHFSPTKTSDLTVTRTASKLTGNSVTSFGFTYSITFTNSNGDLLPLTPITTSNHGKVNLWPTQSLGAVPTVVVNTVQDGSMIYDGFFDLTQTYPHAYLGTPAVTDVSHLRWNIRAVDLKKALSVYPAWDKITVTRSAYFKTGTIRWTGGYMWTITYTKRNGQVPKMGTVSSLIQITTSNAAVTSSSMTLATGTADSPLPNDDPGVSVLGNQVGGTFGFSFTDSLGNPYTSSNTMFKVVDSSVALTAAKFQTALETMLGNKRQTAIGVTRSATVNAVMGYTYTVTFSGKEFYGRQMLLSPDASLLTHTAPQGPVTIAVSEIVTGRNETVYNHEYNGEISCESQGIVPSRKQFANNTKQSACLAKGDLFVVLDPYVPRNNPSYLNLHKAVSVYALPKTPNEGSVYPRMSAAERGSLATYKQFIVESDISSNWAQDKTFPATFRFFKFWPDEPTSYAAVAECGNRGTCNHFEGTCDCFSGYSGDACTFVEALHM